MTRGMYKRNKHFMKGTVALVIATIVAVLSNAYRDIENKRITYFNLSARNNCSYCFNSDNSCMYFVSK